MTIPTKEAFEEYLQILDEYKIASLLNNVYRETFDADELLKIPGIVSKIEYDRLRESSHEVAKWLSKDMHFQRAEKKLAPVNQIAQKNNFSDQIAEVILKIRSITRNERDDLHESEGIKNDNESIREIVCSVTAELRHILWRKTILESFVEFYFTDTAREMALKRKRLPKEIEKFQITFNRFTKYLTEINLYNPEKMIKTALHARINGLSLTLDDLASHLDKDFPISRRDESSKVRLFIHRLSWFHLRFYDKKLTNVVAELLEIEGINKFKELSDIEKLCVHKVKSI